MLSGGQVDGKPEDYWMGETMVAGFSDSCLGVSGEVSPLGKLIGS